MNFSNFFGGLSATRSNFLFPLSLAKQIIFKKHAKDSFTTKKSGSSFFSLGENGIK